MQTNHPSTAPNYYDQVGNHRPGGRTIYTLLTGNEGPSNYKLSLGGGEGGKENWTAPRHRHNFEQIRYSISGEWVVGKDEVIPAGWLAYFPELAYYGPQIKSPNLMAMGIQFGGPSGLGYRTVAQRKAAFAALSARGKFEEGVFTWIDNAGRKHNKDLAEAIWEEINGRAMIYPEGRYRDLVMMNPGAFSWVKDKEQSGLATKRMGRFTERDLRIAFVRLETGASFRLGTHPSSEVLFQTEGTSTLAGRDHPKHSAFSTEADDAPVVITAKEPTEFLYMKLPTF